MISSMNFGKAFGSYSLTETTDLIQACQTPCKYVKDGVLALIPWYFYLLFAVMGGIFIGVNVIFVLSLTRRFIQRVDVVLENFATMIETVAKGLENRSGEEGDVSAEELLDGTAHHPLAIAKAFIYLVDQILERLMVMWNAMIEGGNSTVMESQTKESRLEVVVRELLMEWEKEDKDRADKKRQGEGMVQEDRKVAEICKARNGRKSVAAGISDSRVSGRGPKDLKDPKMAARYNSTLKEKRIGNNAKQMRELYTRFPTARQRQEVLQRPESPSLKPKTSNTIAFLADKARKDTTDPDNKTRKFTTATNNITPQFNEGASKDKRAC